MTGLENREVLVDSYCCVVDGPGRHLRAIGVARPRLFVGSGAWVRLLPPGFARPKHAARVGAGFKRRGASLPAGLPLRLSSPPGEGAAAPGAGADARFQFERDGGPCSGRISRDPTNDSRGVARTSGRVDLW